MSFCKVTYDTDRYYADMDNRNLAYEWVENGPVVCPICEDCHLIFATFERAPDSICGRCREPKAYPWANGKRAKWTLGPVKNMDNFEYPERDYGC